MKEPFLKAEAHQRLAAGCSKPLTAHPLYTDDLPLIAIPGDDGLYFW